MSFQSADQGCGKGRGLQLKHGPKAGRLLFIGGSAAGDRVYFSDDHGASYQLSETLIPQMNEAQLAELPSPPGTVIANMRVSANATFPADVRGIAISTDSGLTFGHARPAPDLIAPANGCMASAITVERPGEAATVYFAGPNSTLGRSHMVLKRSDDGLSFPRARQTLVYSGLGGYSCLTTVPQEGKLGLLWESSIDGCVGAACSIRFSLLDQ